LPQAQLLISLEELGAASNALGDEIESWLKLARDAATVRTGVIARSYFDDDAISFSGGGGHDSGDTSSNTDEDGIPVGSTTHQHCGGASSASAIRGDKNDGIPVAFIQLSDVDNLIAIVKPTIEAVIAQVESVAIIWNKAIEDHVDASDLEVESSSPADVAVGAGAVRGALASRPICPLQPINVHCKGKFGIGGFLFGCVVKHRLREIERRGFRKLGQVTGKTLTHLWHSTRSSRKGSGASAIWGLLHARCPYVWPLESPGLLLYPAEMYSTMIALKEPGRRDFISQAETAFVQVETATPARESIATTL
jgi:hypothetical protein